MFKKKCFKIILLLQYSPPSPTTRFLKLFWTSIDVISKILLHNKKIPKKFRSKCWLIWKKLSYATAQQHRKPNRILKDNPKYYPNRPNKEICLTEIQRSWKTFLTRKRFICGNTPPEFDQRFPSSPRNPWEWNLGRLKAMQLSWKDTKSFNFVMLDHLLSQHLFLRSWSLYK